jgi:hypothetical protein
MRGCGKYYIRVRVLLVYHTDDLASSYNSKVKSYTHRLSKVTCSDNVYHYVLTNFAPQIVGVGSFEV